MNLKLIWAIALTPMNMEYMTNMLDIKKLMFYIIGSHYFLLNIIVN